LFLTTITILSGCGTQKSESKDNGDNIEVMKDKEDDQMEMPDTINMEKESVG
jgi:hypothetical protein